MKKILGILVGMIFLVLMVGGVSALTEIKDCQGLQDIGLNLEEDYVLVSDIDCFEFKDFVQIGTYLNKFKRTLDGKDFTISDLEITAEYAGLFNTLGDGAEIRNIRFVKPIINIDGGYGGLLATDVYAVNEITTIENIYIEGGTVTGGTDEFSGGLIGNTYDRVTVTNCHFSGTVYGAGGLVGQNNGIIEGSSFSGTVDGRTVTIDYAGPIEDQKPGLTGGLVGWNFGTIRTSYSEGTVIGLNNVGGLVGGNERVDDQIWPANIYDSYSTANVEGLDYKGGFMGYNVAGDIKDCYSTGTVTDSIVAAQQELMSSAMILESTQLSEALKPGGFLGYIETYECIESFWDKETSRQEWSDCDVKPKTTEEMQDPATYIDWDTETTWYFLKSTIDYPHLAWESISFCDQFNPLGDKKDPTRDACEQADWLSNEGEETATALGKPTKPPGQDKKGKDQEPNDCYIEKNIKKDSNDDICLPTPTAN